MFVLNCELNGLGVACKGFADIMGTVSGWVGNVLRRSWFKNIADVDYLTFTSLCYDSYQCYNKKKKWSLYLLVRVLVLRFLKHKQIITWPCLVRRGSAWPNNLPQGCCLVCCRALCKSAPLSFSQLPMAVIDTARLSASGGKKIICQKSFLCVFLGC